MASIFLSYAREDLAKAERLAEALSSAGHTVWWDRHLHAGARFTAEIDEALAKADHVVVMWSSNSVESAWVQDEAAAGRDSGRLIPVLIEQVAPPLGFRQYQAVDLSGWSGRGRPRAIGELAKFLDSGPPAKSAAAPMPPRAIPAVPKWAIIAALAGILFAAAIGAWVWRGSDGAAQLSVTAGTSSDPAASRNFAAQVGFDLTRFRSSYLEGLSIVDSDEAGEHARYRAKLGLNRNGGELSADVSLRVDGRPGTSWVDTIEGRADRPADIRQQAASSLSHVLICALQADSSPKLSNSDFSLFLKACATLGREFSDFNSSDLGPTFAKITRSAPDFAPAFAMLALATYNAIPIAPEQQRPAIIREARTALARAKQLDPTLEDVFAAESLLHPPDKGQWDRAFPILSRGISLYPNSPLLLSLRADRLMSVGRMAEAAVVARRSMSSDQLSTQARVNFINALAYSNRLTEALAELAQAEAIWPNSGVLEQARYRLDLRYGDPRVALRQLDRVGGDGAFDKSWENFLLARIEPSAARIEAALQSFRDRYGRNAADIPGYIQALGTFGRADEAFQVTSNPVTVDSLEASTDILFRPHMRSLMYDPRFIRLAHDLGLLAYWRKSGDWPDFCSDPQLPYDCRKEAAKYR